MEIDKKLYKEIKEYCDLNGIKTKEYIHSLLSKAFMADKYGDRPGFIAIKQNKSEIDKAEENFSKIVESVGGPDKYNGMVTDLIFDDNVAKNEETAPSNVLRDTVSQEVSREKDENAVKEEKKSKKRKIEAK